MLLTNITEICFLCGNLIKDHDSAIMWVEDGNPEPLYSHCTCHHKYEILTMNYRYSQAEAKKMLNQHILVFTGGD